MNYIREAEEQLKSYKALIFSVENLKKHIQHLDRLRGPKEIKAAQFEVTGIKGSSKEDDLLDSLYKLSVYQDNLKETIYKIELIDNILEQLAEIPYCEDFYPDLLRKFYIDKLPVNQIADKLGYSHHRSIYEHKEKAIKHFAILLHGLPAVC